MLFHSTLTPVCTGRWLLSGVMAFMVEGCAGLGLGSGLSLPPYQGQVAALIERAETKSYGYDIVESLTTEVGARLAGSPAEARARDWAVAKFKAIGLENVRTDEFMVPFWKRGVEQARIVSPYAQTLHVSALGGSVATPAAGIEAEVAYFEDFDALEQAPMGGLDGKIVFISGHMRRQPDGAGYGPANRKRRHGASEAAKRGAEAVIIRSVGTDSHRFAHTGQMSYKKAVRRIPVAAVSAPDADQIERIFKRDQSVRLHLTLTPEFKGQRPSGNVIGEITGSEKPEEIILIAGHLDSWDLGTGAIDDGAGIGIVMAAAQLLLESGLHPKRTIRVVAFGSEEIGLLGAHAYVRAHENELSRHVLATESDFGAGPVYELRSGFSGSAGQAFLLELAQALKPLGIGMGVKPSNGGPDIGPLHAKGVPALRLQQDGTDYFDYHHTADDTLDKIDPAALAQNVAAFAVMSYMAAQMDINFRE